MKDSIDLFIENHNKTYVYYFEAIILPNGLIEYSVPSHSYKLEMLWGVPEDELYGGGPKKDELRRTMPLTASPIHWLCNKVNCVVCWYNQVIFPFNYTDEQVNTFNRLVDSRCISPCCDVSISVEDLITDKNFDFKYIESLHYQKLEKLDILKNRLICYK